MNLTSARTWYVGAAVLAVLVLIAGWFLAVSPAKSTAADLTEQAAQLESQNALTRTQIAQLQAQTKDLPAQEQRIAAIRQQIPVGPELPGLVRQLDDRADTAGVVLTGVTPSAPEADVTLTSIPLVITVTGEFANIRAYMNQLETMPRAYFISDLSMQLDDSNTTATTTALEATITGDVYTAATAAPLTTPATAPAPAAG
jgi:Tfp pilus assembly protein PilO